MIEETLLERIRHLERKPGDRGAKDISFGVRSIIEHLRKLLNTRQGSVPIADDYGMPDLTNFSGEDLSSAAQDLEHILQEIIRKYEPRLSKVDIFFEPRPGETSLLRFKLEAGMIAENNQMIPVVFETVVTAEGMVHVTQ